ncbi:MAG: aldehyde dehydrogenase family protein, partial [Ktedonobacterales bacterium]
MEIRDKLYIGGQWIAPDGPESGEVINSTTEEVMGTVPRGTVGDVDRAVRAARAAFPAWSRTPKAERGRYLQRIADELRARVEQIGATIAQEVGMPIRLSQKIQVGQPIVTFSAMAKLLDEVQFEERIGNSLVVREPIGVVGCITPWNYPLHQIAA